MTVGDGFIEIVAERFDAGVRLGETQAQDTVAVRIGPDMQMAVAGSPAYFAARGVPLSPDDLFGPQLLKSASPSVATLRHLILALRSCCRAVAASRPELVIAAERVELVPVPPSADFTPIKDVIDCPTPSQNIDQGEVT
jgi:hypothetical protein